MTVASWWSRVYEKEKNNTISQSAIPALLFIKFKGTVKHVNLTLAKIKLNYCENFDISLQAIIKGKHFKNPRIKSVCGNTWVSFDNAT